MTRPGGNDAALPAEEWQFDQRPGAAAPATPVLAVAQNISGRWGVLVVTNVRPIGFYTPEEARALAWDLQAIADVCEGRHASQEREA